MLHYANLGKQIGALIDAQFLRNWNMKIRAAVFDLDGTLVNSLTDLANSANETLRSYGFPPHTEDEYRYFVGNGVRKLIERVMPEGADIDAALEKFRAAYDRRLLENTRPYPEIPDLLTELKKCGIFVGICTNKPHSAAERIAGKLFPKNFFDIVVGDRLGFPRKPDPANLLFILEKLGASPEDTFYFGDSGVDMETAVRAGATPVGVLWGFRERDELLKNGAKILIEHPLEILSRL